MARKVKKTYGVRRGSRKVGKRIEWFGKRTGKRTAETYQGDSVKNAYGKVQLNVKSGKYDELPKRGCRILGEAGSKAALGITSRYLL